jgi:hypothetical protein
MPGAIFFVKNIIIKIGLGILYFSVVFKVKNIN